MSASVLLLVVFPLAFLGGWILSKAYFRAGTGQSIAPDKHHRLLQVQRGLYQRRMRALADALRGYQKNIAKAARTIDTLNAQLTVQSTESAALAKAAEVRQREFGRLRNELREREQQVEKLQIDIDGLQTSAAAEHGRGAAIENELSLLRIEREELRVRVKRLEGVAQKAAARPNESSRDDSELRAELGSLKEKLASREHELGLLQSQLRETNDQVDHLQRLLNTWKHRVTPLASQLQLQRKLLRKVNHSDKQTTVYTNENADIADAAERDNLQQIRGIGPALERRLQAAGIYSFAQLAGISPEQLSTVADGIAEHLAIPVRKEWIRQAQELQARKVAHSN